MAGTETDLTAVRTVLEEVLRCLIEVHIRELT
jgi:hypothetical protein